MHIYILDFSEKVDFVFGHLTLFNIACKRFSCFLTAKAFYLSLDEIQHKVKITHQEKTQKRKQMSLKAKEI